MGLPAAQALPLVYGLCDEWLTRRQILAALGVEDPDQLDTVLEQAARRSVDPVSRAAQIGRAVTMLGGEIG